MVPSRASPFASPFALSSRRKSGRAAVKQGGDDDSRSRLQELTDAQRLCLQIQDALQTHLSPVHCSVADVSAAELQYRLLGAKRYWHRSVKQQGDKSGAKRAWEVKYYEVSLRRSTLERLRRELSTGGWHQVARLVADDVQLTSLGAFDSEKQAAQALDAAFCARDVANPLRLGSSSASVDRASRGRGTREPLPTCIATTRFHAVVVAELFARWSHRRRLELVYESILGVFAGPVADLSCSFYGTNVCAVRGFAVIGSFVTALPIFRSLPFHLTVVAKTPSQWRLSSSSSKVTAIDTERFGRSHLQNDRALSVDSSVLPLARGLLELMSSSPSNQQESKLPHFYHGLPDELKRMIAEEQDKGHETSNSTSGGVPSKAFQRLSKNTEAGFLPKYLKHRRELLVAVTRIQRLLRRNAQSKILRHIARRHRAALCIQRVFRACCERRFAHAYREVMHSAATIIQAVYRSHVARERTKRGRLHMTAAAKQIQRVYRGHVGRQFARWVRHLATSAIHIERVARGFMARRRVQRLQLARYKKRVLYPAVRTIQRVWRGVLGRRLATEARLLQRNLRVLDPAALKIERVLRGFLARRTARRFRLIWQSTSMIQRRWRSRRYHAKWMALMDLRRRDKMASKIGAVGRGYVARQFFKRERRRVHLRLVLQPAAVCIQRVFRGYLVRKHHEDFHDRVEAAITLQQMWRKRSRIQTLRAKLRGFRGAIRDPTATRIQCWYRCCKAKELCAFLKAQQRARQGKAALAIQCAWRSHCSRVQLLEFRVCSRIERKAQALTKWKHDRDEIEFDVQDARCDLKRTIKFKAKALRRIKELKEMRIEWERRQPVVDKELSELTQEDLDRGWGEAFQTEKHMLRFQLELSVEDILSHRDQIREYEAEIEDLRLELEDLERDLEECIVDETMELESYRDMEFQQASKMFTRDKEHKIRLQHERWGVRNVRKNMVRRARDDVQRVESELLAQRQVQELGVLGWDKKRQLQEKIESAIKRVIYDRARQSEVVMEMRRDAAVVAGFDGAIQRMSTIVNQSSLAYRLPRQDLRDTIESPMCDGCGRITCDCAELEDKRLTAASKMSLDLQRVSASATGIKKATTASATNHGHPLRRKRYYE